MCPTGRHPRRPTCRRPVHLLGRRGIWHARHSAARVSSHPHRTRGCTASQLAARLCVQRLLWRAAQPDHTGRRVPHLGVSRRPSKKTLPRRVALHFHDQRLSVRGASDRIRARRVLSLALSSCRRPAGVGGQVSAAEGRYIAGHGASYGCIALSAVGRTPTIACGGGTHGGTYGGIPATASSSSAPLWPLDRMPARQLVRGRECSSLVRALLWRSSHTCHFHCAGNCSTKKLGDWTWRGMFPESLTFEFDVVRHVLASTSRSTESTVSIAIMPTRNSGEQGNITTSW